MSTIILIVTQTQLVRFFLFLFNICFPFWANRARRAQTRPEWLMGLGLLVAWSLPSSETESIKHFFFRGAATKTTPFVMEHGCPKKHPLHPLPTSSHSCYAFGGCNEHLYMRMDSWQYHNYQDQHHHHNYNYIHLFQHIYIGIT